MDMPEFIDVLKALATDEKDETLKAKLEEVIEKLTEKISLQALHSLKFLMLPELKRMQMANMRLKFLSQASQMTWRTFSCYAIRRER